MIGLECDHCGDDAVTSPDGMFSEDMADKCEACGFPGGVSIDDSDEEPEAWWNTSEDQHARCNREDCDECTLDPAGGKEAE